MKRWATWCFALLGLADPWTSSSWAASEPGVAQGIAPGGTIRAAYIVTNLAQARKDPATGEIRGVIADITQELGRRNALPVAILPVATAAAVLDAVGKGEADIGFVAPNPERMGVVRYSRTYMRVQQSFLVPEASAIHSVTELDRPGVVVGANTADSVSVYMKANFKHAKVLESPDFGLKEAVQWLAEGKVAAFGGNRQRLRASTQGVPGLRMLPDNLYGVPQTIAVANDRAQVHEALNAAIDAWRLNGFLQQAIDRSGVEGISVAEP